MEINGRDEILRTAKDSMWVLKKTDPPCASKSREEAMYKRKSSNCKECDTNRLTWSIAPSEKGGCDRWWWCQRGRQNMMIYHHSLLTWGQGRWSYLPHCWSPPPPSRPGRISTRWMGPGWRTRLSGIPIFFARCTWGWQGVGEYDGETYWSIKTTTLWRRWTKRFV